PPRDGQSIAAALRDPARRGGVRDPRPPARRHGVARLSPGAARVARRRGRVSGDVPALGAQGRLHRPAGTPRQLAVPRRPPRGDARPADDGPARRPRTAGGGTARRGVRTGGRGRPGPATAPPGRATAVAGEVPFADGAVLPGGPHQRGGGAATPLAG